LQHFLLKHTQIDITASSQNVISSNKMLITTSSNVQLFSIFKLPFKTKNVLKKGEHIEGVPPELQLLLDKDEQANIFFETLTKSCKQAYCDWVGSAKQEATRQVRAGKAILMLQNKQKTLKIV
jgi:hypothetical protein